MRLLFPAALLSLGLTLPPAPAAQRPAAPAARSSALFNTGCGSDGRPWVGDDWAAFAMPEDADLNGDGDTDDAVLQVVDVRTFRGFNTGLAIDAFLASNQDAPPVVIFGNTLALLVSETEQGKKDLNGDGKVGGSVLALLDLETRQVTYTSLSGRGLQISGSHLAVLTPEWEQGGKDLNGDKDGNDEAIQVYDTGTRETWNSGIAAESFHLEGDWIAAETPETNQGNRDLNGDGDTRDIVPQLIHLTDHQITNTKLASALTSALTPRLFAFAVPEEKQGKKDLNGDSDTKDHVLHVVDLATMAITNTGWDAGVAEVVASGTIVAFVTDEAAQNRTDLNGDRDAFDVVAQRFDLATGKVTNLKQDASGGILIAGNRIVIQTDEESQGKRDLNGDGDTEDLVAQVFRLDPAGPASLVNLRQAVTEGWAITPHWLAFRVSERSQKEQDLNGDGDADDEVLVLYSLAGNQLTNTRQASTSVLAASDRAVAFFTPESAQGELDLNRNGSTDDTLCQIYRLR